MTGQIQNVNFEKGFGFIKANEDNQSYFFHRSGMTDKDAFMSLSPRQTVTFDTEPSPKGPRATNVCLA